MSNVVSRFKVGTSTVDILNIFNGGSWLKGKKIVAYGDSSGTTNNNFVEMLRDTYNLNITNRCIGGSTLSQLRPGVNPDYESNSGYQRITAASDLNTFDYLFIIYTINDWQTGQQIYSNNYNDVYSYEYCVEQIIRTVNTTAPNCTPIFIFPWFCYRNNFSYGTISTIGCTIDAYIDCAISICEKYSINYINMYNISGVNAQNYNTFLRNDGGVYVHANQNLAKIACNAVLMKNINTGYCHGDSWSNNLVSAYAGNMAVAPSEYKNPNGKMTVYPARKFSNAGNCMQIQTVSESERVLMRFCGYAHQNFSVRFFTNKNGSITTTEYIPVTAGWFDMYIDLPNGTYVTPAITAGSSAGVLFWGLGIFVQGAAGRDGMSELINFSGGSLLTWTSTGSYYCSNNMIHFPSALVRTKQQIAAGTELLNGFLPDMMQKEVAFRNGADTGFLASIHHSIYTQSDIPNARQFVFPAFSVPLDTYSPYNIA